MMSSRFRRQMSAALRRIACPLGSSVLVFKGLRDFNFKYKYLNKKCPHGFAAKCVRHFVE